MLEIGINNLTTSEIDKKLLEKVAVITLKGENIQKGVLSIAIVGEGRMREINKKYRGKNRATDVLSFEQPGKISFMPESEIGEIIICPAVIKKNAKRLNLVYNEELARVLIHGILHVLEYDHKKNIEAKKMELKQEEYLSLVN